MDDDKIRYKVQVWIVVEAETAMDAAARVEKKLTKDVVLDGPADCFEVDVDWDSAEQAEDWYGLH